MVNPANTKLSKKGLPSQFLDIMYNERPQMQHIVSGKVVSGFYDHDFGTKKSAFYGHTQTTWSSTDY